MKKLISIALTLSILFIAVAAPSCNKPSQEVRLVRAIASAPVGLKAAKDIIAVLRQSNDVSQDVKNKVDQVCDKTESAVEQIAGDIRAGKFDADTQRQWDKLLTNALIEAQALAPLIKQDIDPRFREWLDVALYTIPAFKALIDQIKPPQPPAQTLINKDAKHEGNPNPSIRPGEVSAIVSISTAAAIKLISVLRDSNIQSLWDRYDAYKSEYHSGDGAAISVKVTKKGRTKTLK